MLGIAASVDWNRSGYSAGGRISKTFITWQVMRVFSDVEKPFLFSAFVVLAAKSEYKKTFQS